MASDSTTSMPNEEKRWVVIGLCLTKVLTPALRDVLATEMPKWHQELCGKNPGIDKQVYGRDKIQFLHFNYQNINNNPESYWDKSYDDVDYAVKDPLSLAKLFVEPYMCKFTGFDQTMDISPILSVIGKAAPFTRAAEHADKVRNLVRNEWAHCGDLANWTEEKFEAAFASMEALLKILNLSCDELNDCKAKGNEIAIHLLQGTYNCNYLFSVQNSNIIPQYFFLKMYLKDSKLCVD